MVRSVLARLAGEGLVTQQVNRRAAVAAPTLDDARDLFRVRHGLERTVVEILAGRVPPDSQLLQDEQGTPYLVKRRILVGTYVLELFGISWQKEIRKNAKKNSKDNWL
mgnify:CR=1 FL=1